MHAVIICSHLKYFLLFFGRPLHCHDDQPGAFSVLDIRPVLSGHGRIPETIQVIILDLEEVSHLQEDRSSLSV